MRAKFQPKKYTITTWDYIAKSSGSQTQCQLYANGFGASEMTGTLPASLNWVQIQIPSIAVTNGQCEIGLRSNAHAGEWANLDDVELVSSTATATTPSQAGPSFAAQVFPNPATSPRTMALTLTRAETVQLSLISLTGQLVRVLTGPQLMLGGTHAMTYETTRVAPGIYVLRIRHGDQVATCRIVQP